ncbi:PspA/IM30 family protein [Paenibacillus sp. 1P07SE]|uniref:PspA/IM30 family protein n=1 Tax=Paenibacillus sp. 1P07SE TaxID=3132209 RepID=UPI0039A47649
MGVLSRFRDVMRSNVNAWLNKNDQSDKAIDGYMRTLRSDLGQVRAEASAMQVEVNRAKRALDECRSEIKKLQRYAERSVERGEEDAALRLLEQKAVQTGKEAQLRAAHELAAAKAERMRHMQEKLVADVSQLELRHAELKSKMADARAQQQRNEMQGSGGFAAAEAKVNQAYDEAMALAELRAEQESDLDELFAELEKQLAAEAEASADPQQELTALKTKEAE